MMSVKNIQSPIMLTMWQAIENNIISADQTICSGVTPVQLTGTYAYTGRSYIYLSVAGQLKSSNMDNQINNRNSIWPFCTDRYNMVQESRELIRMLKHKQ